MPHFESSDEHSLSHHVESHEAANVWIVVVLTTVVLCVLFALLAGGGYAHGYRVRRTRTVTDERGNVVTRIITDDVVSGATRPLPTGIHYS